MKKIIVISDTHSDRITDIPEKLINNITNADIVIHAGDADSINFINDLKRICKQLYIVKGNCDENWGYPEKLIFTIDSVKVGLCHGAGRYDNVVDRMYYLFADDNVDMVIFGHIHHPVNQDIEGIRFLNPGSVTKNRHLPYGTYAELTVDNNTFNINIEKLDS